MTAAQLHCENALRADEVQKQLQALASLAAAGLQQLGFVACAQPQSSVHQMDPAWVLVAQTEFDAGHPVSLCLRARVLAMGMPSALGRGFIHLELSRQDPHAMLLPPPERLFAQVELYKMAPLSEERRPSYEALESHYLSGLVLAQQAFDAQVFEAQVLDALAN